VIHANQVAALADAIGRVAPLAGPADATLSTFFRANPDMGMRDRAFVAVYDAARIPDGPIAKIWFDHHVPITFHGTFAPG